MIIDKYTQQQKKTIILQIAQRKHNKSYKYVTMIIYLNKL